MQFSRFIYFITFLLFLIASSSNEVYGESLHDNVFTTELHCKQADNKGKLTYSAFSFILVKVAETPIAKEFFDFRYALYHQNRLCETRILFLSRNSLKIIPTLILSPYRILPRSFKAEFSSYSYSI